MPDKSIIVDDVTFTTDAGEPYTFQGKHSRKTLSGIKLNFAVRGDLEIEKVEKLCTRNAVNVVDPFSDRTYEATLRQVSSSYQVGRPEHSYVIEITEVDAIPQFQTLEIDGHCFDVAKYRETEHEEDAIGMHALLRLTEEQFIKMQEITKPITVKIRRLGIDENSLIVRCGGKRYWSEHEEGGTIYYKQILTFFPPDLAPGPLRLAMEADHIALGIMLIKMTVRFEALIHELTTSEIMSKEQRDKVLGPEWKKLLSENRIDEILMQTEKVPDAEYEF